MNIQNSSSSDSEGRVVNFRPGHAGRRTNAEVPAPVDEMAKFQASREDAGDYRHRMAVNAVVFLFVIALIGAAVWLADTMATMRKNQDCVLSGRSGCTPVEVNRDRW